MVKKHSVYMNHYETIGKQSKGYTVDEAKDKFLEYLDTVMRDIQNMIQLVKDDKPDIRNFMYYQDLLVGIKNELNAESLSDYHMAYAEELERIVRKYEDSNRSI